MPSKETDLLVAIQDKLYTPETAKAARCLSYFGEHDLGWLAVAGLGGAVDKRKRSKWLGAAAAHLADITGRKWPWLLVPVMMLSRNVLGVHYPTDTLAGAALGAATAKVAIEAEKRI